MLYLVRHGETAANSNADELERSIQPYPLDESGLAGANHLVKTLRGMPDVRNVGEILTSPVKRAMQTAHIIGEGLGKPVRIVPELATLNTGYLAGQPAKSVRPIKHRYFDNPRAVIPGGDSLEAYTNKLAPTLKGLIESPEPHIAVTHNFVTTMTDAMKDTQGARVDIDRLKQKGPIDPAGIMVIKPDWSYLPIQPHLKSHQNVARQGS